MNRDTCKIIAISAMAAALIGLASFAGRTRGVNLGAFIFPLLISVIFFFLYKRK